ncbi:sodium/potassium-transporting ATPase subunit beta-1-like [Toxorhynchites rutilus septentrionalis]|uniref:sodium/potassium-transporting ATPase subunit beta-1-like n=1 Tax=Toxorhynchites rutilus septentrionalis TaxID=329112 RepID=UPI0024797496|nr:sodium/potassium-transporting ATPase subunit beta-1-like [Toxorhynchites rutilus septentrionalis]
MSKNVSKRKAGKLVEYTFEFPQKPEKKTFAQHIYDERDGKFFGRTRKSWLYLFIFYGVYFVVLISLFWLCMACLFATLSEDYPKYQLSDSLIGTNPGLGYRPMPEDIMRGAVVRYRAGNKNEMRYWTSRLDEFLEPYQNPSVLPGGGTNQMSCEFGKLPEPGNVCAFDVDQFGPCSTANRYGYNESKPCIFLKLNRIYGWTPDFYDDIEDLPKTMPADLVQHIRELPEHERKQIWISCNGVFTGDQEAIGSLAYYPSRSIPPYHFPYTNTKGYLSPLVAVQFLNLKMRQNVFVECRAWAKNIIFKGGSRLRMGSVQFSMLIE